MQWAEPVTGSSGTPFDDAVEFRTDPNEATRAQIAARIDMSAHRLFDEDGEPIDGAATHQVRFDARRQRGEDPAIRMASFDFDDTDPTADPETERVDGVQMAVGVPDDGAWHEIVLEVPKELLVAQAGGAEPNTATLIIDVPPALRSRFAIDNLQIEVS